MTANKLVTQKAVKEAIDILRGAVMIVYPMGLPPHDNIKIELENNEDRSGTQKGQGAPQREHAVSEEDQKRMMAYYYRKQEMKKLDKDAEDAYLDLEWADARALKRNFHHLKDIKLGPRG